MPDLSAGPVVPLHLARALVSPDRQFNASLRLTENWRSSRRVDGGKLQVMGCVLDKISVCSVEGAFLTLLPENTAVETTAVE